MYYLYVMLKFLVASFVLMLISGIIVHILEKYDKREDKKDV